MGDRIHKFRLISDQTATVPDASSINRKGEPFAVCSLPPHSHPIAFYDPSEFEIHYKIQHAYKCEQPKYLPKFRLIPSNDDTCSKFGDGMITAMRRNESRYKRGNMICGKRFPSTHLLSCHMEECHSILARERQARGDKIFACLIPSCSRVFSTSKRRRQHLASVHNFVQQSCFNVVNHGMDEFYRRYGSVASLILLELTIEDINSLDSVLLKQENFRSYSNITPHPRKQLTGYLESIEKSYQASGKSKNESVTATSLQRTRKRKEKDQDDDQKPETGFERHDDTHIHSVLSYKSVNAEESATENGDSLSSCVYANDLSNGLASLSLVPSSVMRLDKIKGKQEMGALQ